MITRVTRYDRHWIIYWDDGKAQVWRHSQMTGSDDPLNMAETAINDLCVALKAATNKTDHGDNADKYYKDEET